MPQILVFSSTTRFISRTRYLRAMGAQKRIESFFTAPTAAKKSKATDAASGSTPAATSDAAGSAGPATDPPAAIEKPLVAASPSSLSPTELKTKQADELQRLRAHANRNCALAKQVVIRAENAGTVPSLGDLLIEESWRSLLGDQLQKDYFKDLEKFVTGDGNGGKLVFPPKDSIFRAFNSCPVDKVRVVILGQDPYHDLGQAQGLSFSVPEGKQIPSSLRNIYKELKEDLNCPIAPHGCLEKWANQGVLLLNAVLTVRAHNAASHAKRGWEKFTDEAVSRLAKESTGVVFLLWGKYAQEKGKVIDGKKHHVLTSAHPSGLSAHRGFFGCKHFSKANELLEKQGKLPIDWCI